MRLRRMRQPGWLQRLAMGLAVAVSLAGAFLLADRSVAAPQVTTDKTEYFSAETVHASGTGFAAGTQYDIPVIRPDGSIVKGDGSFSPGWDSVASNGSGAFTYDYKLDGVFGVYEVRVYPKPWSGNTSETPLASTTFSDADIEFTQCQNDSDNNGSADPCSWTTGGLNPNNSIYGEDQAVPQRLFHKLTAPGVYKFRLEYDFSKGSIYAYDFLTSGDGTTSPQSSTALLNACGDLPSFITNATACSGAFTSAFAASVPSDSFDSVPSAESGIRAVQAGCFNNVGVLSCKSPTVSNPSTGFPCFNDATCPSSNDVAGSDAPSDVNESHLPDTDPDCVNTVAPRCGTAAVAIDITVEAPSGTSNSTPTIVALWFAGHLASQSDWGSTGCGSGGGDACGASQISGAPFHLKYICLEEPGSGSCDSVGNRDNQISPGTVLPGSITIEKQTNPDGDPQSFSFTCTSPLGSFSLSDGGTQTFPGLAAGPYTCTEAVPSGWASPPSISCNGDTDGGSTVAGASVTIDLDGGENITCTFNNTKLGTITIVKNAVPDDAQDFSFTCTSPIGSFTLDDDGTAGNPFDNSKTTSGLAAGTYTCTETVPSGWASPPTITCSDPDGGTPASSSSVSVAIDLDAGETVSCTFINTGGNTITIIKDAVPDDAQAFGFTCTSPIGSFTLDDDGANGNPFDNSKTTSGLVAGTYTCTETVPSGWASTPSITCSDPDGGTPASSSSVSVTIDLDPGETVSCTFANTKDGTIIVQKTTYPSGDTTSFPIMVSGPTPDSGSVTDATDLVLLNRAPGSYTVSETVPSGWQPTGASCNGGGTNFTLAAGQTVTCTFTNARDGAITIIKDAVPDDAQAFSFTCTSPIGSFMLDDDGANGNPLDNSKTTSGLAAGTYTCTEAMPPGWSSTPAIACSDPDGGTPANGSGPSFAIDLDPGETVSCTITNNLNIATFNVAKNFAPDFPGADPDVTMSLSCTSGTVAATDPTANEEAADTANFTVSGFTTAASCTASEPTTPAGYTTDESGCLSISITPGGTSSCTITNNYISTPTPSPSPSPSPTPTPSPSPSPSATPSPTPLSSSATPSPPTPTPASGPPIAVGGSAGLIEDDGTAPTAHGTGSHRASGLTPAAVGVGIALVLAVAWVARRRVMG